MRMRKRKVKRREIHCHREQQLYKTCLEVKEIFWLRGAADSIQLQAGK